MEEEDLRTELAAAFQEVRDFSDIVDRIPDERARRGLADDLRALFGIDRDYGADRKGMGRLLMACRLRLDALPDYREKVAALVDRCIEAIRGKQEAPAVAGAVPVDAPPAAGCEDAIRLPLDPALPAREDAKLPSDFLSILLPGPGRSASAQQMSDWLNGRPWSPGATCLRLPRLQGADFDHLCEVEAELVSAPASILQRHRALWVEVGQEEESRRWLASAGRDVGAYSVTVDVAVERFRSHLVAVMRQLAPAAVAALVDLGAEIVMGADVGGMLCDTLDLEAYFLAELGNDRAGPEQDLRGAIAPDGAFHEGLVLRRAAMLYLTQGGALSGALRAGLEEFRLAQAMRGADDAIVAEVTANFDELYAVDCATPIEQYRIAKNEYEPSF